MSNENNENNKKFDTSNQENETPRKKKRKRKKNPALRIAFLVVVVLMIIGIGAVSGMIIGIIKSAPEINPENVLSTLTESSVIVDENGTLIEQIRDPDENREIVELKNIPKHLQDAFVAIEDHRFRKHFGIDLKRIAGSVVHNLSVGDMTAQGASTITQQLVKNLYLTNDKVWERKIKEMYLAIMMERKLSKDEILENYLNTIPLGQSTYGVQAASYAYFSKDVSELTLAESALLAGTAKSTVTYSPYGRYDLNDIDTIPEEDIVGYVYVGSVQYACVFNQKAIDRQHIILDRMKELKYISDEEYNAAMSEDMRAALNPGQTKIEGISSNFADYVKEKVIEDLMSSLTMSYEQAESYLYKGGLTVYATMDINMQKSLESSYNNFGELYLGSSPVGGSKPMGQDWRSFRWSDDSGTGCLDEIGNVLNEYGQLIYYKKENIMDEKNRIYLNPSEYEYSDSGDLIITSKKFNLHSTAIDTVDCYTIDKDNNFVSHKIGGINIGKNFEIIEQKGVTGSFKIPKSYLDKNPEMFVTDGNKVLYVPTDYFYFQEKGIVQPQSATVIMDYKTGKIKSMIGGRNIEGSKTFNRAVDAARQPGSTIKPLSVYLPALDLGYTAASPIDDLPKYLDSGRRWPQNWYENKDFKYRGITSLRVSVEQSINTNAVTMIGNITLPTSMEYLAKFGLINKDHPENDTFVTAEEDNAHNDVNAAAMALGGLTKGFSPLAMTSAYGVIANDGVYVEPICYTKVVNSAGKTILEKTPETHVVVSPEVAFIMKDILRTTVTNGLSSKAKLPKDLGIEVAGKTGTTQINGDFWFIGFTPYYVGGIWVGNDNVQMKLSGESGYNARLWSNIMTPIHKGLSPAKFEINPNVVTANVCLQSGKIPTNLCSNDQRGSQVKTEYFVPGTQPTGTCDVHVAVEVCSASNMLKSQFCPGDQLVSRVFVKRAKPYDPNVNPDYQASGYTEKLKAAQLYDQVVEDMGKSPIEDVKKIYAGQVTFDENNKIIAVYNIPIANLGYTKILARDYMYQLPTATCTYHTLWHYNQWLKDSEKPDAGTTDTPDTGDGSSTEKPLDETIIESGDGNTNDNTNNNTDPNPSTNTDKNNNNNNNSGNDSGDSIVDIITD